MGILAMCDNQTCPVRTGCARHEAGGATPKPTNQQWLREQHYTAQGCAFFLPPLKQKVSAA